MGSTGPRGELTTKALHTLVRLVQAHFPKTWEAVLRVWEWQTTSF